MVKIVTDLGATRYFMRGRFCSNRSLRKVGICNLYVALISCFHSEYYYCLLSTVYCLLSIPGLRLQTLNFMNLSCIFILSIELWWSFTNTRLRWLKQILFNLKNFQLWVTIVTWNVRSLTWWAFWKLWNAFHSLFFFVRYFDISYFSLENFRFSSETPQKWCVYVH